MVNRRDFISLLACSIATPKIASAQAQSGKIVLYASVGAELTQYDVDLNEFSLVSRGSVTLPAGVQYAWPHVSGRYIYVASSNGGVGSLGVTGDVHHASAFRVDPSSGALTLHGNPITLQSRPIHITTDIPSRHVLIAYNSPSRITVHRVNDDGTIGTEVKQAPLDPGIYAHQTRVTLSNRTAILVTRGNDASGGKPEDPGALKVFDFNDGLLTNEVSIAPGGGYGFGPRHLDFHPTQPWMYVSLERQNQIWVYKLDKNGIDPEPTFKIGTLANPLQARPRQIAGTVHVHSNGRFVYGVNRADGTMEVDGKRVFIGGENTIVVYEINPSTGGLKLIQHANTQGFHARTFHVDPTGRMLVAANLMPLIVRGNGGVQMVPASLSVFRIGGDGKLDFVRKYDVDVGDASMFWMGMMKL